MCDKKYFILNEPVSVVIAYQEAESDEEDTFKIDKGQLGEIIDQRNHALFLPGWVRIAHGPNDEFFVKMSNLQSVAEWLTENEYQAKVAAKQIFQETWLDKEKQFELIKTLEVCKWLPNTTTSGIPYSVPVYLPIGTVGKVYELAWDYEGSDDKQYWVMGIEVAGGQHYDVMYPELLKASKAFGNS